MPFWIAIVAVHLALKSATMLPMNPLRTVLVGPAGTVSTASVQPAALPPRVRHALTFCQLLQTTVSIAGNDLSGESFAAECTTIAVAHDGLIVRIARVLAPDQEVFVRRNNHEVLAHVMGYSRDGTCGLSFDTPRPGFWGELIEQPHEATIDTAVPGIAPDPLLVAQFEQFEPPLRPQPAERGAERRRSPRITMRQAKACIESADESSEVVELINVSRGGICFRSDRVYTMHCSIRVAAPYTEASTPLFVDARIVRVHRDSWGGVYGVEYTR